MGGKPRFNVEGRIRSRVVRPSSSKSCFRFEKIAYRRAALRFVRATKTIVSRLLASSLLLYHSHGGPRVAPIQKTGFVISKKDEDAAYGTLFEKKGSRKTIHISRSLGASELLQDFFSTEI